MTRSNAIVMDKLLSDPNYDFEDVFLGVWDLSPKLTNDDWLNVLQLINLRSEEWKDNLILGGPYKAIESEPILSALFAFHKKHKQLVINLLCQCDPNNLAKNLNEEMIDWLMNVWTKEPKSREKIESIVCALGLK